jgi:hypothetical protein
VPIPAELDVPLGLGANVVPMVAAAPDASEVLCAQQLCFPDSSKFHAMSLPYPTILHVLHTQTDEDMTPMRTTIIGA